MTTLSRGIDPGTVPYGQRAQLDSAVDKVTQDPATGGMVPAAGTPAPPTNMDPLSALMGGGVVPPSGNPLTSGLSVGPGSSPQDQALSVPDDTTLRLQAIAESAASPQLRLLARSILKQRVRTTRRATQV